MTPNDLSFGLLSDLMIAWAEGEMSRGFLAELTGLYPDDLQGMKDAALGRAKAYSDAWCEAGRPRRRWAPSSTSGSGSAGTNTTDPPGSTG
jgi:hypothetical protein